MRKVNLAFCLLIIVFPLYSESLEGFWGINWGASSSDIRQAMSQKGYSTNQFSNEIVIYDNVRFAGRDCGISFLLSGDRLFCSAVTIIPSRNGSYDAYISLKNDLTIKYNKPTFDIETYKPPYTKGDGYTETAISLNYTKILAAWMFDDGNYILLSVSHDDKKGQNEIYLYYLQKSVYDIFQANKQSDVTSDL